MKARPPGMEATSLDASTTRQSRLARIISWTSTDAANSATVFSFSALRPAGTMIASSGLTRPLRGGRAEKSWISVAWEER